MMWLKYTYELDWIFKIEHTINFYGEVWIKLNSQAYLSTGLVFGVNSAPFEAQFISQDALELKDDYPLATDTVLNLTFSMESVTDENCGIKLYQELSALWEKVNMAIKFTISFGKNNC